MRLLYIILTILLILVTGCTNSQEKQTSLNNSTQHHSANNSSSSENITIKRIYTNPSIKNTSAYSTIKNELEWELSNGKIEKPTVKSIKLNSQISNNSIFVLRVPSTSDPWLNIIFTQKENNSWKIKGIIDSPVTKDNFVQDKKGLSLPFNKFVVSNLKLGSENNIWVFTDKSNTVVITTLKREPIQNTNKFKTINVNKHEAWVQTVNKTTSLYYFDEGKIIWVAGNVTEEKLINLTNSLPLVTSAYFPFKQK